MAVTAEVDIANSTLIKLGDDTLTAAQYTANTLKRAKLINEIYAKRRDEVMQLAPWTFAVKELRLIAETHYDRATITGITAANPPVVTAASHGFSDGDKVYITDVEGMTDVNKTTFWIEDKTDNTFELVDEDGDDIDGSSFSAYASAGFARRVPAIRYEYQYLLPTDCLKVLSLTNASGTAPNSAVNVAVTYQRTLSNIPAYAANAYEFKTEGMKSTKKLFKCNLEERDAFIKYIQQITDVTVFDELFIETLALRMAYELAKPIANSDTLGAELYNLYQLKLKEAQTGHALENTSEAAEYVDTWLSVRK
jgi:hypothetical protein